MTFRIARALPRLLLAGVLALASAAQADTYPTDTVRVVVPSPAGGLNDILARLLAQRLADGLKHTVVVENRGGGNGLIGGEYVARARPDGHTLLLTYQSPLVVNYERKPDGILDLATVTPITRIAEGQLVLVVHPSVPASTLQEYLALVKASPGKFRVAAPSVGSIAHLAQEVLWQEAGIRGVVRVPYAGSAPALKDLIGGHTTGHVDTIGATLQHIRSGRLKALAVASARRSDLLPEVPTVVEAGVPAAVANAWFVLAAPAGTRPDVVDRLNREVQRIVATDDYRLALEKVGASPIAGSVESTNAHIREERERWQKVVDALQRQD